MEKDRRLEDPPPRSDRRERERERDRDRERERGDDRGRRRDPGKEERAGTERDPLRISAADDDRGGERGSGKLAQPQPRERAPQPTKSSEPETPTPTAGNKLKRWRDEMEEMEDARDLSDDDEALDRKREEAKRRREAILAKAMEKKQGDEPGDADITDGKAAANPPAVGSSAGAADDKEEFAGGLTTGKEKNGEEGEDGGDIFDASEKAAEQLKKGDQFRTEAIGFTGASGDDWDDADGYYIPKIGEVMGDRYLVLEAPCGRGVFSNVVKAKDQQAKSEEDDLVAIKVMRANDMMTKAAEREVEILEKLNNSDKKNKRHIIRLLSTFAYRRHFCLVFECMRDDLRAALKKYTKNKGMALQAVRAYTQQLLVGLGHMRENGIIHADIKPDNILISKAIKGQHIVKFCDLGTALEAKDVLPSPYLASRFYRPPEVIVGCEYSYPVDMWALGCTLYEIFTGRTLLQSKTNNDHLKKIMELRGKVPGKVIKKGAVWKTHFTDELDFKHEVEDPGSGQKVIKTVTDFTQKGSVKDLVMERVGPEKRQSTEREDQLYVKRAAQFADLLEQMLALDPDKRVRPEDALQHPFLQDSIGKAAQAAAAEARSGGKR